MTEQIWGERDEVFTVRHQRAGFRRLLPEMRQPTPYYNFLSEAGNLQILL